MRCYTLKIALNINDQIQQSITEMCKVDWKTHNWTICCPQETHSKYNDVSRLKVKGWKKIHHANMNVKEKRVAILISDNNNINI